MSKLGLWHRYKHYLCDLPGLGLRLDISRMNFDEAFLQEQASAIARALEAMDKLERGAVANIDESRMVGHYWLRAPDLAPDKSVGGAIRNAVEAIKDFAEQVHSSAITPEQADGYYIALVIGIGGSALGPQFVADALGTGDDPMIIRFIDNTDPDGIDRTLAELDDALTQTLTIVVSKSGSTIETRNAMLEVAAAYEKAGLNFARHAVAVTCENSRLHQQATAENWLRIFPMWDWVGGRTSQLSAVGLLPAALQGIDVDAMLEGARVCDEATRGRDLRANPAALMALMWHYIVTVRGRRNMVILPYRDRLALLGRYLQQLVMESVGKERDRRGDLVHQGLTVYGNKGSTDQHAYVQQLHDGPNDFFVTFLDVQRDREGQSIRVEDDTTTGDYLAGFLQGTRTALRDGDRESLTITLDELNARSVGILIALFERAVGLYAELIDVNAYDQPGVEAGKKAASAVIDLQRRVLAHLRCNPAAKLTADELATEIGGPEEVETVFHILEHAAANTDHGIIREAGLDAFSARFGVS